MNKKILEVLPAICCFVAGVIFFVVVENIALGACFTFLGFGNLVRVFVKNKNNKK